MSIDRSFARKIARRNMEDAGYTRVVKSGFFARNWRKFVEGGKKR